MQNADGDQVAMKRAVREIITDEMRATNLPEVLVTALVALFEGQLGLTELVAIGTQGGVGG